MIILVVEHRYLLPRPGGAFQPYTALERRHCVWYRYLTFSKHSRMDE